MQIAAAAGSADVVALFLHSDPSLASLMKAATGNSLLHYAALGPPHVAEVYKAGEVAVVEIPEYESCEYQCLH